MSANKILTGLRFVKKNRIIQVEVQQSSPLPEGVINETDRSWIQNSSELTLDDKYDIFEMSYDVSVLLYVIAAMLEYEKMGVPVVGDYLLSPGVGGFIIKDKYILQRNVTKL